VRWARADLETTEVRNFFSYVAFDLSESEIDVAIAQADQVGVVAAKKHGENENGRGASRANDVDGLLVRWEFIELCAHLLWRYPLPLLRSAASAYKASVAQQREVSKNRWRAFGSAIDRRFLWIMVPLYTSTMVIMFCIELDDSKYDFQERAGETVVASDLNACLPPWFNMSGSCVFYPEQFQGIQSLRVRSDGIFISSMVPAVCLCVGVVYAMLHRRAKRRGLLPPERGEVHRADHELLMRNFSRVPASGGHISQGDPLPSAPVARAGLGAAVQMDHAEELHHVPSFSTATAPGTRGSGVAGARSSGGLGVPSTVVSL
jgi:hypothetical protein